MLEKTAAREKSLARTYIAWRGEKGAWMVLCGLAVWAIVSAAAGRAAAEDGADAKKNNATAYLQLNLNEKMLTSATGQNIRDEFELFKKTQKQLIKTPIVLFGALRQPKVAELPVIRNQKEPVEWLSDHLAVTFPDDAQLMRVRVFGADAKDCDVLVNAVVDSYYAEVVDAERKTRLERVRQLKDHYEEASAGLRDAISELRQMAESLGVSESETLDVKQKNVLEELRLLRGEYVRGRFELNRMRRELASLKAALVGLEDAPISEIECLSAASSDPMLKKLGEEIAVRQVAEDDKNRAELERMSKIPDQRLEEIREQVGRKKRTDLEREIKRIEASVRAGEEQQALLEEDVKRLRTESDRFGATTIEMQMLRRQIAKRQKVVDNIYEELQTLHGEAKTQPPRVLIFNRADVRD
jgi:hypothetical protein